MELTEREAALFQREAENYSELLETVRATKPSHPTKGVELTSIGHTGGASNVVQGEPGGGFLMRFAGRTLIVDPGENSVKFLVNQGFNPYEITDVLASHPHNDHVGELSLAVSAAINLGLGKHCDGKIIAVPALMDYTHANSTRFGFTLPSYAWKAEVVPLYWRETAATLFDGRAVQSVQETVIADTIKVRATEARHGSVMSAGFVLDTPAGRIGYSGDTEYFPQLAEWHEGSDVLWLNMNTLAISASALGESSHTFRATPTHTHLGYVGACQLIDRVKPKTAVVTHFGAQLSTQRTIIEATLQARFEPLGISVFCPQAGDSFVFDQGLSEAPRQEAFRP